MVLVTFETTGLLSSYCIPSMGLCDECWLASHRAAAAAAVAVQGQTGRTSAQLLLRYMGIGGHGRPLQDYRARAATSSSPCQWLVTKGI